VFNPWPPGENTAADRALEFPNRYRIEGQLEEWFSSGKSKFIIEVSRIEAISQEDVQKLPSNPPMPCPSRQGIAEGNRRAV
jgi:hypothetical protein